MPQEFSFDMVSKTDMQEVVNAVQQAQKELAQRFDFKGSKSSIELSEDELTLVSDNEGKLLQVKDVEDWQQQHGPLPAGGWLLFRTGWDSRAHDQTAFLNANETGPHTPGVSPELAKWLGEEAPIVGFGVETVGTDAGTAHSFEPAFPCHYFLLGARKYGLTQLANLSRLPPTGAVLIAAPLPIVRGSGSPARVLALVPR